MAAGSRRAVDRVVSERTFRVGYVGGITGSLAAAVAGGASAGAVMVGLLGAVLCFPIVRRWMLPTVGAATRWAQRGRAGA